MAVPPRSRGSRTRPAPEAGQTPAVKKAPARKRAATTTTDVPLTENVSAAASAFGLPPAAAAAFGPTPWANWLSKAAPASQAVEALTQGAEAMGRSIGATLQSIAGLSVPGTAWQAIQQEYVQKASQLWNQAMEAPAQLEFKDRRFAAPEWHSNPAAAFTASMYLLNAQTLSKLADSLEGDDKAREIGRAHV